MDDTKLEIIKNKKLNTDDLIGDENIIAQNILKELNGITYIRAMKIIDFCKDAIKYTKVDL